MLPDEAYLDNYCSPSEQDCWWKTNAGFDAHGPALVSERANIDPLNKWIIYSRSGERVGE